MRLDRNRILSYEDEERLRTALAALADDDEAGAPAHVEAALVSELRRRNRRSAAARIAAAGGIAAAVLAGLWLLRPVTLDAPPPEVLEISREAATPSPAPAIETVIVEEARPVAVRRVIRRPAAPRPAVRLLPTDRFIPVGVWQAVEPMERGSIVRVRLPKSSLPVFGIAVIADRANESVPADVLLGEDGSLRAIRLVSAVQ